MQFQLVDQFRTSMATVNALLKTAFFSSRVKFCQAILFISSCVWVMTLCVCFVPQNQVELAVDTKFFQYLREIELTLEAILVALSDDAVLPNDGVLFSSIFEAFWVCYVTYICLFILLGIGLPIEARVQLPFRGLPTYCRSCKVCFLFYI